MASIPSSRLKPFFLELVGRSFSQLQVGDREVANYVSTVLADFSRRDNWLRLRDAQGRQLDSAVEMWLQTVESGERDAHQERELRKYIGDYSLFMAGVFRAFVQRQGRLDSYLAQGSRSYHAVYELDAADLRPGFTLFEELSRGFERYAGALDYMQKCFFAHPAGTNPFAGVLRQIERLIGPGRPDN
ncbi:MAG TPA: hypothetical protein VKV28_01020 [Candidatus Binataceae bacterium]|nr:hypothetical protein [Candidatus Binataceae bacterium]